MNNPLKYTDPSGYVTKNADKPQEPEKDGELIKEKRTVYCKIYVCTTKTDSNGKASYVVHTNGKGTNTDKSSDTDDTADANTLTSDAAPTQSIQEFLDESTRIIAETDEVLAGIDDYLSHLHT